MRVELARCRSHKAGFIIRKPKESGGGSSGECLNQTFVEPCSILPVLEWTQLPSAIGSTLQTGRSRLVTVSTCVAPCSSRAARSFGRNPGVGADRLFLLRILPTSPGFGSLCCPKSSRRGLREQTGQQQFLFLDKWSTRIPFRDAPECKSRRSPRLTTVECYRVSSLADLGILKYRQWRGIPLCYWQQTNMLTEIHLWHEVRPRLPV